jgi:hypothetical protein
MILHIRIVEYMNKKKTQKESIGDGDYQKTPGEQIPSRLWYLIFLFCFSLHLQMWEITGC